METIKSNLTSDCVGGDLPPAPSKYPATIVAHWSTGPVPCCEAHASQLVGLGRFMGLHVALTAPVPPSAECENCKNAAAVQR